MGMETISIIAYQLLEMVYYCFTLVVISNCGW